MRGKFASSIRNISIHKKPHFVIATAAGGLIIVDLFFVQVSAISLGLLVVALSPWLMEFISSVKLPGGGEVQFRERLDRVAEHAKEAGLLVEPSNAETSSGYYDLFSDDDGTMALARLRIELERRLVTLAEKVGVSGNRRGVVWLTRALYQAKVLGESERRVIEELIPLLNAAVHAERYEAAAANWAINIGPKLLAALDERIKKAKALPRAKSGG